MDWTAKCIYPFSAIVGQEEMTQALILNAIFPSIGGLLIRGEKGTAKSTAIRALAAVLPEIEVVTGCPFNCDPNDPARMCPECRFRFDQGTPLPVTKRKVKVIDLPLGATEDMVIGSLDLECAVRKGKKRFQPGLLAHANRGILYIDEINLLNDHIVDVILDAAATGLNTVEREGISFVHEARFILVGTMNPEEGELRPQLLDRFGMCLEIKGIEDAKERVEIARLIEKFETDPMGFIASYKNRQDAISRKINDARRRVPRVSISDEMIKLCSILALDAFVAGHRADITMQKVAIAIASLEGREEVVKDDVRRASELVLFHRTRMPPSPPQKQEEEKNEPVESPSEDERKPEKGQENQDEQHAEGRGEEKGGGENKKGEQENKASDSSRPITDEVFPIGNHFKVKRIQTEKDRVLRKGSGRRSRTRTSSKAGRYVKSTMHRKNNDLALDATLRAAAPYQKQRYREGVSIVIEEEDIREKIREKRIGNFIVFVVDASGSMGAGKRMTETKGAIISLLMDAYQKRDKIAMVAFRGDSADLILPPTNSVELAHKLLEKLPTGGKTPLCHGISLGYQVILNYFRKDPNIYPILIVISDGKANVSKDGGKPIPEVMEWAEEIRYDQRVYPVVVDVEKPGLISFGLARQLSARMGARYFRIKDLKADTLVELLREDLA